MKKFFLFCSVLIIIYAVAYDLKIGTLPHTEPANAQVIIKKDNKNVHKEYTVHKVLPGDTLISVTEQMNKNVEFSIESMISDFQKLNPGTDPDHIQLGKTYKFPLYKTSER